MNAYIRKILLLAGALALVPAPASAIPVLQLYIEGSTYDQATDTWVVETDSSSFRLWTIGNTQGPGGANGSITDVHLSAAYGQQESGQPTISLTGARIGGAGTYTSGSVTFTDPSTPTAPSFLQLRTDGSSPSLSDGSTLPAHGIYGSGTDWQEFALGDFTLADSPVADFINSFPTTIYQGTGQINAYDVTVTGDPGLTVHFDLYDHIGAANHVKYIFAPFSHDAEGSGGGGQVPEPNSLALLGLGLAALPWLRRGSRLRKLLVR